MEEIRMGKLEPGDQASSCHAKVGAGSYVCFVLNETQTVIDTSYYSCQ